MNTFQTLFVLALGLLLASNGVHGQENGGFPLCIDPSTPGCTQWQNTNCAGAGLVNFAWPPDHYNLLINGGTEACADWCTDQDPDYTLSHSQIQDMPFDPLTEVSKCICLHATTLLDQPGATHTVCTAAAPGAPVAAPTSPPVTSPTPQPVAAPTDPPASSGSGVSNFATQYFDHYFKLSHDDHLGLVDCDDTTDQRGWCDIKLTNTLVHGGSNTDDCGFMFITPGIVTNCAGASPAANDNECTSTNDAAEVNVCNADALHSSANPRAGGDTEWTYVLDDDGTAQQNERKTITAVVTDVFGSPCAEKAAICPAAYDGANSPGGVISCKSSKLSVVVKQDSSDTAQDGSSSANQNPARVGIDDQCVFQTFEYYQFLSKTFTGTTSFSTEVTSASAAEGLTDVCTVDTASTESYPVQGATNANEVTIDYVEQRTQGWTAGSSTVDVKLCITTSYIYGGFIPCGQGATFTPGWTHDNSGSGVEATAVDKLNSTSCQTTWTTVTLDAADPCGVWNQPLTHSDSYTFTENRYSYDASSDPTSEGRAGSGFSTQEDVTLLGAQNAQTATVTVSYNQCPDFVRNNGVEYRRGDATAMNAITTAVKSTLSSPTYTATGVGVSTPDGDPMIDQDTYYNSASSEHGNFILTIDLPADFQAQCSDCEVFLVSQSPVTKNHNNGASSELGWPGINTGQTKNSDPKCGQSDGLLENSDSIVLTSNLVTGQYTYSITGDDSPSTSSSSTTTTITLNFKVLDCGSDFTEQRRLRRDFSVNVPVRRLSSSTSAQTSFPRPTVISSSHAGAAASSAPAAIAGAAGSNGLNGRDGHDGASGASGARGPAGPAGAAGSNGLNGRDGAPGPAGARGLPGAAYDKDQARESWRMALAALVIAIALLVLAVLRVALRWGDGGSVQEKLLRERYVAQPMGHMSSSLLVPRKMVVPGRV